MLNIESIKNQLSLFILPVLNQNLPLDQWLKAISIQQDVLEIQAQFGFPVKTFEPVLLDALKQFLSIQDIKLTIEQRISAHAVPQGLRGIPGVKNIIAVASGKGGVGKSTTAVNLACALQQEGARVGILDADIYGPNQPQMLGLSGRPQATAENRLKPLEAHGLQAMSIGFLIEQNDTPMIWRGPMVSSALQQLLNDTAWDNLDYLIIDLPPGTGDIQLTLSQKIPVSAAIIVTTPQDIALLDVRKAIRMFEKVHVPVLGIIENMSYYHCPHCQHEDFIFGTGGAEQMENQFHTPCLGKIPLQQNIREQADQGDPIVIAIPKDPISTKYREIAIKISGLLALQEKDKTSKFPKIVIEKG